MNGTHLRIYTYENRKHAGKPLYEWLLEAAKAQGIPGGSVFRAMAGYGRHGVLHEERFFELAGSEPVLVEFVAGRAQIDAFLGQLRQQGVQVFYAMIQAEFAILGGDAG